LGDTWDYNFLDEVHIYEHIIKKLVEIYKQYKDWLNSEEVDTHGAFKIPYAQVLPVYLEAPRLYFDARIVPEERKMWNIYNKNNSDASLDTNMFSMYELMIYTLQNRVDEFKFDIEEINFTLEEMKIELLKIFKTTR
jgi:hypothetical protein